MKQNNTRRMNTLISLVTVTSLLGSAFATNEAVSFSSSMRAVEKVFHRSEEAHRRSMDKITKSLTPETALTVLHKNAKAPSALLQVAELAVSKHTNLRRHGMQIQKGGGVDGARKMLNNMIFESASKYDAEIAKCTEYYASQCSLMQMARGEISAANFLAANSRAHILNAQGSINRCEVDIPTMKTELGHHNTKCEKELKEMNDHLKVILSDIEVMNQILKMTECGKKSLLQGIGMMKCTDPCTHKSFITFQHEGLKKHFSNLKSGSSKRLAREAMEGMFEGSGDPQTISFHAVPELKEMNSTAMPLFEEPMPRTEVPANPCNDPDGGAPSMATKGAAKCTIAASPQCWKLQERFLLIQSGILDEKDDLLEEIQKMEGSCEETKGTIETVIANDQSTLDNSQTKLADATESEATAGETARQTSKQFNEMNGDLVNTMKTCNTNYINFETELCALKKIRGELYKMSGASLTKSFFVDCEVTKWEAEECSVKCGGGAQKLERGVITHPNNGAKCLPLEAMRSCNLNPCPVDCKLESWSGFSKCSAECGGGVKQRLREVSRAEKHGGKPCGETSETIACNNQACEKDCVLGRWSEWSSCSKACDVGSQKKFRLIKEHAVGEGKCADEWDTDRLKYRKCNMQKCVVKTKSGIMHCGRELDVVLLLDGSASLGKKGWEAEIQAARNFVKAFKPIGDDEKTKAMVSVTVFSGPKTYPGVRKCTGNTKEKVDMKECGINTITHYSDDMKRIDRLLVSLEWPKGSTLTSLALATAKAELGLSGRKNSQSIVVVFTDGRPFSFRKTKLASHEIRKAARLMWVAISKNAPLADVKNWATRRWQENVVVVEGHKELEKKATVNHLIADMCTSEPELPPFPPPGGLMNMELPSLDETAAPEKR